MNTIMQTEQLIKEMQKAIDLQLRNCVSTYLHDYPKEFVSIFEYQLGWDQSASEEKVQGKRIRPLLLLLSIEACGGEWKDALPAAAAIELVHNFSLIHDDIQDKSQTRRGRETIWVKWGEAQAINAGDAMLTLAHLSLLQLSGSYSANQTLGAVKLLQLACLRLTRGQYLDLAHEKESELPLELYWEMVEGKTSALLSGALSIGGLLSNSIPEELPKFEELGKKIGFAFQVQDDWLGIWGNTIELGKSTESDLAARKKTYPILLGISKKGEFSRAWLKAEPISEKSAREFAMMLKQEGVSEETKVEFQKQYRECYAILNGLFPNEEKRVNLQFLVDGLLNRIV
jgi:geranylgeranyl diphosphate synthase, type I